jgi:GNAT superfamily N-acetyltransferase
VAEHRQPFADVRLEDGGFSIPALKWRELRFVQALRPAGDVWVRDPARSPGPFAVPGLLPAGARYRVEDRGSRVLLVRVDASDRGGVPAPPDASAWPARLERAEAGFAAATVEASTRTGRPGALRRASSGVAAFVGPRSPLTHAVGLGMDGAVDAHVLDEVERFYRAHHAPVEIDLCPHAHPSLLALLGERGYRLAELNTVLARALEDPPAPVASDAALDWMPPGGEGEWVDTVARAFHDGREADAEMRAPAEILFHACAQGALLARAGSVPAGGAGLGRAEGVALLLADAVLPGQRGRGVHAALIAERLRVARQWGCDLAMACTLPGSGSERNYLRAGFAVAYTRVHLVR